LRLLTELQAAPPDVDRRVPPTLTNQRFPLAEEPSHAQPRGIR
jgi:hypothetical protein